MNYRKKSCCSWNYRRVSSGEAFPPKPKESIPNNKRKSPDHGGGSCKKVKKHYELCAKNDGPANTHNTDECRRYNPDGSRKYQKGKSNGDKKTHNNFSQQLQAQQDKIKDLEQKVKRIEKKWSNEEFVDNHSA